MFKNCINLKNILFVSVFLFIVFIICFLLKYDVLSGDDIALDFYDGSFWDELIACDHGRYLACIQEKFFPWFASLINVHPNALVNTLGAFIKGFDIAVLCLIFSLFPYLTKKTTLFSPLIMAVFFIFYINKIAFFELEEIQSMNYHFGYCCGSMLYFAFIFIFGYILLNKPELSALKLITICIFGFLSSLNDTYAVNGVCFLLIMNLYILCSVNIKSNKENCKNIAFISLSFLVGAILSIKGMLSDQCISARIPDDAKTSILTYLLGMMKPFSIQFFNELILKYYLYFICIILLLIFSIKSKNQHKNTYIAYSLSILFSAFGFFFSLISGGTESFYEKGRFWISHSDLQLFYNLVLTAIILILSGCYFLQKPEFKQKIIATILFVFVTAFSMNDINFTYTRIKDMYNNSKKERIMAYKAEKMYLYYTYNDKRAILPASILEMHGIASSFWVGMIGPNNPEDTEIFDIYERNGNTKDYDENKKYIDKIEHIDFDDAQYRKKYIKKIYRIEDEKLLPYVFERDENAFKKFTLNGGIFSNEETKLENIDFNRLLDKKFVIEGKT